MSFFFCNFALDFEKIMSTFIGNIEAKMDEKGRVFVPAAYRRILGEEETKTLVMRRDTDNECIIVYPERVWNEKVEALRLALDEWDPEDQLILMQFMADAEWLEMDSQGRILLSKKNLENIGATDKDIQFVGMLNRFAIWSPAKYAEKMSDQHDLSVRIRQKMGRAKG